VWAERYIERPFALKLVPLRGNGPIGEAWNDDQKLMGTAGTLVEKSPMANRGGSGAERRSLGRR